MPLLTYFPHYLTSQNPPEPPTGSSSLGPSGWAGLRGRKGHWSKEGKRLTAALHFFMTELFSEAQMVISLRSNLLTRLAIWEGVELMGSQAFSSPGPPT